MIKVPHVRVFSQVRNHIKNKTIQRCISSINNKKKQMVTKGYSDANIRYVMDSGWKSGSPLPARPFLVLGIETSCDDTGASVVCSDGRILSNVVYSQHKIHESFGGIVPNLALEAHRSNIDRAVEEALSQAGLKSIDDVDAVAVTKGPGLEVCLRVGMRKAQALAELNKKTFVAVHHLEAHCLMVRLAGRIVTDDTPRLSPPQPVINKELEKLQHFTPKVLFPFLVLLASGGHTAFLVCHSLGEYTLLGGTLDDSLGEAFDKAARLLGLNLENCSGGVALEKTALNGDSNKYKFTKLLPMKGNRGCDVSYSGLKSAFRMELERLRKELNCEAVVDKPLRSMEPVPVVTHERKVLSEQTVADLSASFQHVAFAHLEDRLSRALDYVQTEQIAVNGLVVVGGVAANLELRRRLLALLDKRVSSKNSHDVSVAPMPLIFPPPGLCTDNGAMAAWAGVELLSAGISHDAQGQEVVARWPLGLQVSSEHSVFSS